MKFWSEAKMLRVLSALFLGLFISLGVTSTLHILSPEHHHHCIQADACKADADTCKADAEKGAESHEVEEHHHCHLILLAQNPFSFTPHFSLPDTYLFTKESYSYTIEEQYLSPARYTFALRAPPYTLI